MTVMTESRETFAMKICIVEDNKALRQNLELLLNGEPGFKVTGAFGNAEDALKFLPTSGTTILLVDIDLPGMSGVELIEKVKPLMPDLNIMAYTVSEDRQTVFSALKAGACGYLLKGCPPSELIESLCSLHQGGAPMSPKIARKVIHEFQAPNIRQENLLTPREKEILSQVAAGCADKEIAAKLFISPHTVHTHIKNIYEKLHVHSHSEALQKARQIGVI